MQQSGPNFLLIRRISSPPFWPCDRQCHSSGGSGVLDPDPNPPTQPPSSRPFLPLPHTHPTFNFVPAAAFLPWTFLFLWRTASGLHSGAQHHLLSEAFLDHTVSPNPHISPDLALAFLCLPEPLSLSAGPASSCQRVSPSTWCPQPGLRALPPPPVWLLFQQTKSLLPRETSPETCLQSQP